MDETLKKKPSKRRYILAAVIVILLITPVFIFILLAQEPKPDPASEAVIKGWVAGKLKKDPNELIDKDYESFDTFLLFVIELSDIKLLEKFTNLQKLGLADIRLPKKEIPEWMKILSRLGVYDLNKRFSIDLSPLENLNQLKLLTIQSTPISSLNPLKELTNLEALFLVDLRISDLKPLMKLKNLRELTIKNCENITDEQIEDLQKALPELEINR